MQRVEARDPFGRRELHIVDAAPRAAAPNHLRREQADSALGKFLATRKYPGLELTIEYHPGMGHRDVMGTLVVPGLRTLYGK